jgi:hypothetical protein
LVAGESGTQRRLLLAKALLVPSATKTFVRPFTEAVMRQLDARGSKPSVAVGGRNSAM